MRILSVRPLGFPWETADPFLFCVHHDDRYPRGNERLGPAAPLAGRDLGQDFSRKDGWSMYHGLEVPGFPQHPHRGFETVTVVRQGFIDHSDSLGAKARFGMGDAQWLTAGKGIVHCEMFPLLERERDNPVELFQIWLNLPAEDKMAEPHFSMLWSERIPRVVHRDEHGRETAIALVAGALGDLAPPPPPPRSWASRPDADVAIWTLRLAPHARFRLPAAKGERTRRTLYFFAGATLTLASVDRLEHTDSAPPPHADADRPPRAAHELRDHAAVEVRAQDELELVNGPEVSELLMLQGKPIGQPVVQYGPFVMNSREQIQAAVMDYRRTRFGGWPFADDAPTHARDAGRFAQHADGTVETKR
jgi:redox-sensitive bicupin YhaK (pirin superfamily)